jgi:predicted nucleic acid-binding protein
VLVDGRRKSALDLWLIKTLLARFDNRLLRVDVGIVDQWGHFVARAQAAGRPIGAMAAFFAATAQQHQLTLVTRNVSDFKVTGIRLFNPWTEENKA